VPERQPYSVRHLMARTYRSRRPGKAPERAELGLSASDKPLQLLVSIAAVAAHICDTPDVPYSCASSKVVKARSSHVTL
jgi:hypothetical protein